MATIRLTSGRYTLVDQDDLTKLAKYNWYENDQGYCYTKYYLNGKQKHLRMHRFIMNTPDGEDTDHINRNRLDNRKANLRVVDRTQNNYNTGLHAHNTSGHKGVAFHKAAKKWVARIQYKNKSIHLGTFLSLADAINARKNAEKELIVCQ